MFMLTKRFGSGVTLPVTDSRVSPTSDIGDGVRLFNTVEEAMAFVDTFHQFESKVMWTRWYDRSVTEAVGKAEPTEDNEMFNHRYEYTVYRVATKESK